LDVGNAMAELFGKFIMTQLRLQLEHCTLQTLREPFVFSLKY